MAFRWSSDRVSSSRWRQASARASGMAATAAYCRCGKKRALLATASMACAVRPQVCGRIIRHAGANGIEFDITVAVQDHRCHRRPGRPCSGLSTTFRSPVTGVELADTAASEFLREASDGPDFWWRSQQMDGVVHQHLRVQCAAGVEQRLVQQRQVALPIVIVENAGQSIVSALNNMLRNSG